MLPLRRGYNLLQRGLPEVPIIPVVIDGAWHGVPTALGRRRRFWCQESRRHDIRVVIGEPIFAAVSRREVRRHFQELGVVAVGHRRIDVDRILRRFTREGQGRFGPMSVPANRTLASELGSVVEGVRASHADNGRGSGCNGKVDAALIAPACSTIRGSNTNDQHADRADNQVFGDGISGILKQMPRQGELTTFDTQLRVSSVQRVALRSEDIATNALVYAEAIRSDASDRILVNFARDSIEGIILGFWLPILVGALCWWVDDDAAFAEMAIGSEFTLLFSRPEGFRKLRERTGRRQWGHVRYAAAAGVHLPLGELTRISRRLGLRVLPVTSAPELGGIVLANVPSCDGQPGSCPGSIGHPLPGVAIRVVHPLAGGDVEDGEIGQVLLRSATQPPNSPPVVDMLGREHFPGWIRFANIGWLDERSFVHVGRRRMAVGV